MELNCEEHIYKKMCKRAEWFPWVPAVGHRTQWGCITGLSGDSAFVENAYNPKRLEDLIYYPRIDEMFEWLPEQSLEFNPKRRLGSYLLAPINSSKPWEEIILAFVGHHLGHKWDGKEWIESVGKLT